MSDPIHNRAATLESPAWDAWAITPSDSDMVPNAPTRALYIGTGGNLTVDMGAGRTITLVGVLGGTILPIRVDMVFATGTTATDIVGLY
jgi:hypothetical protein